MLKNILVITFIFSFQWAGCQNLKLSLHEEYQNKIKTALNTGGRYAATVALDSSGKAKGDYNLREGIWHEYEPAWHTGQLIYGLLEAFEVTHDTVLLATAVKAGNWWTSLQFKEGHVLKGYLNAIHGAEVGNLINTTTITDGTPGLYKLSEITKNPKYAQVASDAAKWILSHLYLPKEKLIYNMVEPTTGEIWKDKSPHKQHQHLPITLKMVARPNVEGFLFKDAYEFTSDENFKVAFLVLADGLVETQSENGFWMDFEPNNPETGKIHARFNTWNAEALLEAYTLSGNKQYLGAAVKTADALAKIQQPNGFIYYSTYTDGSFEQESPCGSAVSFAGILWLRLYALGYKNYQENIMKALEVTLKNQYPAKHPDINLAGSFFEIRQRISKNGEVSLLARDIATAFGLRFLAAVYKNEF